MAFDSRPKRRFARLTLSEPLLDQVTASQDVAILDLSLGGARVEHTIILRPGSSCHLRVPLKTQHILVLCSIIWSRAIGRTDATQGGALQYQSGLEFSQLSTEAQALLTAFIEERGTPPGDDLPGSL